MVGTPGLRWRPIGTLAKEIRAAAAANLPPLLANRPRDDFGGPRRGVDATPGCSWSSTAISPAGTCRAAALKSTTFGDALRRELAEEGRIRTGRRAQPCTACSSTAMFRAATMSQSTSSGISIRIVCPSRTARLWPAASSRRRRCRRKRPWAHGCGYPKCWRAGRRLRPGARNLGARNLGTRTLR